MKYSICSWTFGNEPLEKIFDIVTSVGFEYIDLHAMVDEYDWKKVNNLAKQYSLKINGLLSDSAWPNEKHDLANKSILNRQKAIDHFKRQIESVSTVNGNYLVLVPSAVGKYFIMGENKSEDWKWAVESVHNLTETAEEYEVKLVLEPINRYESCIVNNSSDVLKFVQEINHPNVRALLDTYHMNIEEANVEDAFLQLKDWIEVVHFADSNRRGIGRGQINFQ